MFYIFNAVSGSCGACDQACSRTCRGLDAACASLGLCAFVAKVLDRPLGGYVVVSLCICAPAAVCAVLAALTREVRACDDSPLLLLCAVNGVCGASHIGMGLYLQSKLARGLGEHAILDSSQAAPDHPPSSRELMERAWHIVLYDVAFCVYLLLFLGSWVLQLFGMSWIGNCKLGSDSTALWASSVLLVFFGVVAVGFGALWSMALACDECCAGFFRPSPIQQPPAGLSRPQRSAPLSLAGAIGALLAFLLGRPGGSQHGQATQAPVMVGGPVVYAGQPPPGTPWHPQAQPGVPVPSAPPMHPGGHQDVKGAASSATAPGAARQVLGGAQVIGGVLMHMAGRRAASANGGRC